MPTTLTVKPWPDPLIDTLGYDPRSRYVETFWLPTLGPTALLLLRHLADRFDRQPDGLELTVADTCRALGLGQRDGNSSPIVRTLERLAQFDLACDDGHGNVAVRRNLPPVNRRHLRRLPSELQVAPRGVGRGAARRAAARHRAPQRPARRVHAARAGRRSRPRRACRCTRSGFHPAVCHESARAGRTTVTAMRSTTRRRSQLTRADRSGRYPAPPAVDERRVRPRDAPLALRVASRTWPTSTTIAGWLRDARTRSSCSPAPASRPSRASPTSAARRRLDQGPAAEKTATLAVLHVATPRSGGARGRTGSTSEMLAGASRTPAHRALVELERKARAAHARHPERRRPAPRRRAVARDRRRDPRQRARGEVHGAAAGAGPMDETLDRVRAGEDDPACLDCGGILKSATISLRREPRGRRPRAGAARGGAAPTCSSRSARRSASTRRPRCPRSRCATAPRS